MGIGSDRPHSRTPRGVEQRLLDRARRVGLIHGDHLVIGFSGGRDSLALAAASRWLIRRCGIAVTLVHIDHGLRETSAVDAERASGVAALLGLPLEVRVVCGSVRTLHPGVGLEAAARRERYRLLSAVAIEVGARVVATAHHRGDQAETVLLHMTRGSGLRGTAAMAEWTALQWRPSSGSYDISQEIPQTTLWRPLIHESLTEITTYVENLGLVPIHDPSNDDLEFRRNALRHLVLPLLEQTTPGAAAALARFAQIAAEEDELLDTLARAALVTVELPGRGLHIDRLLDQPLALQRRVVRLWMHQGTSGLVTTLNRTDAVLDLVRTPDRGREVEIGEGWTVHRLQAMLQLAHTGMSGGNAEDGDGQ